jgi:NDP-sugar pyrophosphorylase family protein
MEQVVVLSGGLATRMRPMTETIPKALIEIAGKPFVYHQLKLLKAKGVSRVVMCLGYLGHMIEDYVGDGARFGLSVKYSYDGKTPLGTGGALKKAEKLLDSVFFVLYGDSYLDIDYAAVECAYRTGGQPAMMTIYRNDGMWDTSNVIYEHGRLVYYSKQKRTPDMRYIDYGLGVLTLEVFADYKGKSEFDLADVYENLCEQEKLAGFEVHKRFYEIGSPNGLCDLEQYLREKEASIAGSLSGK